MALVERVMILAPYKGAPLVYWSTTLWSALDRAL